MPRSGRACYLDSSALVKLVVAEPESPALRRHLRRWRARASCGLARVEVVRAVRPHGPGAIDRARRLLGALDLLALDEELLDTAAMLDPLGVRSLDAIHLAAALRLGGALGELVTYDLRMAEAATTVGVPTSQPT